MRWYFWLLFWSGRTGSCVVRFLSLCMDGWMDGRLDGWMDGCTEEGGSFSNSAIWASQTTSLESWVSM
jgi:hypothetical protein